MDCDMVDNQHPICMLLLVNEKFQIQNVHITYDTFRKIFYSF